MIAQDSRMTLRERIESDYKEAFKAKDEARVSVVRLLKSAITNAEIAAKNKGGFSDEEILRVFQKEAKKREEASLLYRKGGRGDLLAKEEQELAMIGAYLPAPLEEGELMVIIEEVITGMGKVEARETGRVIGQVMKRIQGRASGEKVSQLVREQLQNPKSSLP